VRESGEYTFSPIPENMPDSIVYVDDSAIHGKGLFAKTFIPAGTLIGVVRGRPAKSDGDHVLWIDENTGIQVLCNLRYINHSDTPNAAYYDNLEVRATADIEPGEEITHDYDAGWND
jgi:SET domain-containing protein